jgi:hypothetical protein
MQNHVSKSRIVKILGKHFNFALHQQSITRKTVLLFVLTISLMIMSISRSAVAHESSDTQPQLLTQKQVHSIADFTTFNGQRIKEVKLGWESYGELNADKSNAILITHYFTGTSHAAGKYAASDVTSGYWDSIIGPNKAIDTNTFFVVSMDSLANLNVKDKNVITTGPASINPATGNPYGLTFPVITMRDMVNTQKSLLESLGIQKLYAEGVVPEQKRDETETKMKAARESANAAKAIWQKATKGAREEDKTAAAALVDRADAAIMQVQAYLDETSINSISDGEVSGINVEEGELVPTGFPVVTILNLNDIWVTLFIREDYLSHFKLNSNFMAQIPGLDNSEFEFKVSYISPTGDFARWNATKTSGEFDLKSFEIEARPVNKIKGLRPGMTTVVTLTIKK